MIPLDEYTSDLSDKMFKTYIDHVVKDSSPAPLAENNYCELYALLGERMPQEYVTMMVMSYYLPRARAGIKY